MHYAWCMPMRGSYGCGAADLCWSALRKLPWAPVCSNTAYPGLVLARERVAVEWGESYTASTGL